jgi:hypothetical protein
MLTLCSYLCSLGKGPLGCMGDDGLGLSPFDDTTITIKKLITLELIL